MPFAPGWDTQSIASFHMWRVVLLSLMSDSQASSGGVTVASFNNTLIGWTIGAGVEYAFTNNLIGRAEYRYTDFGSEDLASVRGFPDGTLDLSTNDIRLGIAYKF